MSGANFLPLLDLNFYMRFSELFKELVMDIKRNRKPSEAFLGGIQTRDLLLTSAGVLTISATDDDSIRLAYTAAGTATSVKMMLLASAILISTH